MLFEGVDHSLRRGEATGWEAIASTIHAFAELVRATMPPAVNPPTRFVDLSFELAHQAISFERRFFYEVLSGLQRVIAEPLSDVEVSQAFNGQNGRGSESRSGSTRRVA